MNARAQQRINAACRLPVIRHSIALCLWLGDRWMISYPVLVGILAVELIFLPHP